MLVKSPLAGVTMRHLQSSVMTETHCPVKSIGAAALALAGGGPPASTCACKASGINRSTRASSRARIGKVRLVLVIGSTGHAYATNLTNQTLASLHIPI